MNIKLNSILLVDDDAATNYLHRIMIEDAECKANVHVSINGKQALEYLKAAMAGACPMPELIFLDINMPIMNGWEFLEWYAALNPVQKAHTKLIMLTTSINPDDLVRAQSISDVSDFKNKALTVEMIHEIVGTHFH